MIREVQYEEANPALAQSSAVSAQGECILRALTVTASVASLIIGTFIANIIEVEIDPGSTASKFGATWDGLDVTFNTSSCLSC